MAENPPATDATEPDPQNEAETPPPDSSAERGGSLDTDRWGKPAIDPESNVPILKKLKLFFGTHYLGVVAFLTPIIFIFVLVPFPPEKWQWCAYCLCIMASYWVFECIPLPVTGFLPVLIFPLSDIMSTRLTCLAYMNDTVMMFLGSIMLAASVEQSGLHKRIALYSIKLIGYSHLKMLFAVAFVTMFVSMWITNTAAATLMVPILFALLKVYENQKLYKTYDTDPNTGEMHSTQITSCYFCCATYAATIGGIGTLVGTVTNLTAKGLFLTNFPKAPELLSFPSFSAFTIPYMLVCNLFMYLYLAVFYMGLGRPSSAAAKKIKIPPEGILAAKKAVEDDIKALGPINCHEIMVLILFGSAMIMFFARSPQIFTGWGDALQNNFHTEPKFYRQDKEVERWVENAWKSYWTMKELMKGNLPLSTLFLTFVRDSVAATLVIFLMLLLPASGTIFKNCKAKFVDQLPKGRIGSALDWDRMNSSLPYSFCFLLAGGFAMSTAAAKKYSNLNGQVDVVLEKLEGMPLAAVLLIVIILTVFITNFASNVAVCNVIAPIAMQLAVKLNFNPLWCNVAAMLSSSFCFMLPVGTPGNLIVQSAAKIPTSHMIVAGAGPTVTTIIFTWLFLYLYGPVIWPTLHDNKPDWVGKP